MHANEIVGYVSLEGEVYCASCFGEEKDCPIFASDEGWENMSCGGCSHTLECSHTGEQCEMCSEEVSK